MVAAWTELPPSGGLSECAALVELAERLRWSAPELVVRYAERALAEGGTAEAPVVVRANALVGAALVRLGRYAEAVKPALVALRAADQVGPPEFALAVRLDLAACARALGESLLGCVILRPVLESAAARSAIRAGAITTLVGCTEHIGRRDDLEDSLAEAERLLAADDTLTPDARRLERALLAVQTAAYHRRYGETEDALEAAHGGLGLLAKLRDRASEGGRVRVRLTLEVVCALLDDGELAEATRIAEPVLGEPVRAASADPAGRLLLAVATRVALPGGKSDRGRELLGQATWIAERHGLDWLLADALTELANLDELAARPTDALTALRAARAAEHRQRRSAEAAKRQLMIEFGARDLSADGVNSLLRNVVRAQVGSLVRDPLGRDFRARDSLGREPLGRELVGREMLGREPLGRESLGRESTGREALGRESVVREPVGRDALGRESLVRESAGREALGRESVVREPVGRDALGRELLGREQLGYEAAGRESAGRGSHSRGRESAPLEPVGREALGREARGREAAARESVSREYAVAEPVDREALASPPAPDPETDAATGLLTRAGLSRRLQAVRSGNRPVALTLVRLEPVDSDPAPADEAGPDEALTALAGRVRDMAPEDAELARSDGSELAVLLPHTTRDQAEEFAATIRESAIESEWLTEASISTGVAQSGPDSATPEDADSLLIAARETLTPAESDRQEPSQPEPPAGDEGPSRYQEIRDLLAPLLGHPTLTRAPHQTIPQVPEPDEVPDPPRRREVILPDDPDAIPPTPHEPDPAPEVPPPATEPNPEKPPESWDSMSQISADLARLGQDREPNQGWQPNPDLELDPQTDLAAETLSRLAQLGQSYAPGEDDSVAQTRSDLARLGQPPEPRDPAPLENEPAQAADRHAHQAASQPSEPTPGWQASEAQPHKVREQHQQTAFTPRENDHEDQTGEAGLSRQSAESGFGDRARESGVGGLSRRGVESGLGDQAREGGLSRQGAGSGFGDRARESGEGGLSRRGVESGFGVRESGGGGLSGQGAGSGFGDRARESGEGLSRQSAESGIGDQARESDDDRLSRQGTESGLGDQAREGGSSVQDSAADSGPMSESARWRAGEELSQPDEPAGEFGPRGGGWQEGQQDFGPMGGEPEPVEGWQASDLEPDYGLPSEPEWQASTPGPAVGPEPPPASEPEEPTKPKLTPAGEQPTGEHRRPSLQDIFQGGGEEAPVEGPQPRPPDRVPRRRERSDAASIAELLTEALVAYQATEEESAKVPEPEPVAENTPPAQRDRGTGRHRMPDWDSV